MRNVTQNPPRHRERHQILGQAATCTLEALEKRRLLCGLSHEFLIDAPQWSDEIEQQGRLRLSADGPDSPDAVSIEWSNRSMASDNFAATFGTIAEDAREVVDKALEHWSRVITSWNRTMPGPGGQPVPDPDITLQVNISIGGSGFGGAGAPAPMAPADGRPRTGSFTIGAGNPVAFPDPNDSNGWYIDPNPDDHAEFSGALVNPYSGNSLGLGPDFYSLAVAELTHVLGLISDRNNDGTNWQGYRLESSGLATNTGIADNADGAGTFWAFDGPTIDHLMTSFNGGGSWGNIVHSANPNANINFNNVNWRGSASAGNGSGNGGRIIPDYAMAHVLADAYGYSIREPWEFDTFHYLLNRDTGELRIRGGRVNTSSDDIITIGRSGSDITVSVDVGEDVPGTGALPGAGNLPAFVASFPSSQVTSIVIAALDGDDTINVEGAFANIPILIDGGFDNDTINLTPTGDNLDAILGALTIQGNNGTDTLVLHDTANGFADTYEITNMTLDRDVIPLINYNGLETVRIDSGNGGAFFNVRSLLAITTLNINAGGDNDSLNIGSGTNNADLVDGNISFFGQGGTNDGLIWHDESNTSTATYTLTSNSLTRTGSGAVTYGTTEAIVIHAASGDNIINVNSTAAGSSTTVNAGGGADTINVALSAAAVLTVNGGDANDTVNLNNPGSLSNIITLNGNASTGMGDTLNYNATNSSANDVYEINSGSIERTGNVDVFHGTFELVVINAGVGNDRFDVESTAAGTTYTVNANIGTDVMNVTLSSGNLGNADGPIVFNGDTGSDSVTLWDNLNAASGIYTVTATQATRAGFGGLSYFGTETFTLSASTVNDTINLNSTAVGTSYALNGNDGNDGFRIANSTQDLSAIAGIVSVNGGTGNGDGVVLFDSLSNASQTTTITSNQVIHPGFGPYEHSNVESVVFEGGSGNDVIDVMSAGPTTPVTARGNGGDDQFRLANGNLGTLLSLVHVEGGTGTNTTVLRDHSTVENDGFTVTATQITHPNFGGLVYSDLTTLTVEAGFGNNTFTVNSTSSLTDIRLKGNAGNDFYEVNSTNALKPVIIDAGSGTTNVINSIPAVSAGLVIENNQTLQSLTLIGDVRASFAGSGASIVTQFVTVLSGARFNLGTNALIVDYSGASPLSAISALVSTGYNGGAWNGVGINSSAAAASGNTGIGIAEATDLFSSFPASFAGRSIDNTSVLLKHTFYGDTNLDGNVNLTDFNRLAANFGQSGRRWVHGDNDYNNNVNLSDFNRLAANFGSSGLWPQATGQADGFREDPEHPGLDVLSNPASAVL